MGNLTSEMASTLGLTKIKKAKMKSRDKYNRTCSECEFFIGGGDWNLCCTQKHEGFIFGFLCYEDTEACEKFKEKQ